MALIATASAVIAALKAGSTVNDPHPALHVEERTAIATLQQNVLDLQALNPMAFTAISDVQAAYTAGTVKVGQLVIVGSLT